MGAYTKMSRSYICQRCENEGATSQIRYGPADYHKVWLCNSCGNFLSQVIHTFMSDNSQLKYMRRLIEFVKEHGGELDIPK
jgi:ribosomal protein L37AE/L43A